MNSVPVSVVIVNYNVKELVLTCLNTLFQYNKTAEIEVIVVDNNSNDGSCDAIKTKFPNVILIENNFNAGFPQANNQGFKIAKGEYIFMLNPDTEFLSPAIDQLVDYMEKNQQIMMVGPKLLNTDNSLQQSFWRFPTVKSVFLESFYLQKLNGKKNYADIDASKPTAVESVSGAAIFFRKELLDLIGGLDETMFWIEDVEFCYRLNKKNEQLIYNPNIQIYHHIGQSAKKNYNISISNQVTNKIKFFKKYGTWLQWKTVVLISFLHVLGKIVLFGILSPFNVVYFRKFKAYLYTFPRVFNPPTGIA